MWYFGSFPYSVKKVGEKAKLFDGSPSFRAKDGRYTIARFQGDAGKYTILGGEYKTVDRPHTFGTYMWAEFKDWAKVERKMIEGPYIHHMSEIEGEYTDVIKEFCKFITGIEFDPIKE